MLVIRFLLQCCESVQRIITVFVQLQVGLSNKQPSTNNFTASDIMKTLSYCERLKGFRSVDRPQQFIRARFSNLARLQLPFFCVVAVVFVAS